MSAWEQRKFGDCVLIQRGGSPRPIENYITKGEEGINWVKIGDVSADSRYITCTKEKIIPEGEKFSRRVQIGDLILSNSMSFGRPYIMAVDGCIHDGWLLIRDNKNLFYQEYLLQLLSSNYMYSQYRSLASGGVVNNLNSDLVQSTTALIPNKEEQSKLGAFFSKLDNLITLHQRKFLVSINHKLKGEVFMLNTTKNTDLFCEYYAKWIRVYKEGAIRKVTMDKYLMTYEWLKRLIPSLMICEMNRIAYQQLINDYAELHERQTTMDFHHQLKGAILDAVDEGLIEKDPTRKAIIKGKTPRIKKIKYLNQFELHTLLTHLNLGEKINWDWFILLVAKTGMRFSEALALTPKDFDFAHQSLSINKTWNYKEDGGFLPTKNKSSVRKIQIDWQTVIQFSELLKFKPEDEPIFVETGQKIYNSTVNDVLTRHCKQCGISEISIHGLRHTHASLLLFAGVSIASVARRLGHASMTTTQKTYLHIIQELENKDVDLIMRTLSGL